MRITHWGRTLCAAMAILAMDGHHFHPLAAPASEAVNLSDNSDGRNWAAYGRTYGEQHYSPLTDINAKNVQKLGLAWSLDLPPGNVVTQPLEVDGTIFFTVGNSIVHAVSVTTGKELWVFNPHANEAAGDRVRASWGSRGLGYWKGKVYTGTVDGRLIAIDAKTGKEVWSQQTLQPGDDRYITGAPRAFDGKVIIGHGGADSADIRGYVTTYDAETGKQLWRFYLVPGDPAKGFEDEAQAMAAKTWFGEWWKYGGGGNVWNSFTYDADTDTILMGTGNGAPWNQRVRSEGKGDNLFLCSIVALDAKTGKYKWHYQINPGETWDYNASMDMHLAELKLDGQMHKVLVTAPKNGFLYVIDRTNGKLLSYGQIAEKVTWATGIDLKTGRPIETPDARFPNGKTFVLFPSMNGAHTNLPSAFSPKTGMFYMSDAENGVALNDVGIDTAHWRRRPRGVHDFGVNIDMDPPGSPKPSSNLVAWDPMTQKAAWRVPTPSLWNGGVMVTGGDLVFEGLNDGNFNAYDAHTGKLLWTFKTEVPVFAAPITYSVNGQQYVSVLAGSGLSAGVMASVLPLKVDYRTEARRLLTFKIGGTTPLPPATPYELKAVDDPDYKSDAAAAARGRVVYGGGCFVCHGLDTDAGGGIAPDLKMSTVPQSAEAFDSVVRQGALIPNGMPAWSELTDSQMNDLRQFLRSRAAELRAKHPATN